MSSLRTLSNPDTLDDSDLIWGVYDEVPTQEWSKMDEEFTNTGYREGITAGKESALQEGFDDGFDNVGAPVGRELGVLRGVANAVMSFLSSSASRTGGPTELVALETCREEVRSIIGVLGRIHLADLAPRDRQAEEHAREHMEMAPGNDIETVDARDSSHVREGLASFNGHPSPSRPAVEELSRVRIQLAILLHECGLDISLA